VWLLRIVSVAVAIGAWFYATGPGGVSPLILPSLPDVFTSFWGLFHTLQFWGAVGTTLLEIAIAGAIAGTVGIVLGFAMSRTRFRVGTAEPLLAWGYMVPLILFYPIFILWLGVGMWSKIGYAAVSAFFPIAYNAVRAFSSVDDRFLRVGRAFGGSAGQIDRLIKFRAAAPMIVAGLRIGAAATFITVIVAEMLASQAGLGYQLARTSETFQRSTSFGVIIAVLVLVALFQYAVGKALPTGYGHKRGRIRSWVRGRTQ
jgi:NitT/TauT family transport system permease protein